APEQKAVIGRIRGIGQVEVGLALGLHIAVEQHLFLAPFTRRAEKARVLAALAIGRAVGVGAVLHWDGGIVLLDAPPHFSEQRALKLLGVGHERLLIGVLSLQMGADVGREPGGVLQYFLPVFGPEPGIVVNTSNAVMGDFDRAFFSFGWSDGRKGV